MAVIRPAPDWARALWDESSRMYRCPECGCLWVAAYSARDCCEDD